MAFGKKKQTGSDESVGAPVQQAPMKAKKKNEMLSSVLSESVVEKLLDEFKEIHPNFWFDRYEIQTDEEC